ncbi:metal ABC transporter substrate-binding protein [Thalassiella azotivora]
MQRPRALTALLLGSALGLGACGTADGSSGTGDGGVPVVASFYPLEYAVAQVGGDRVSVTNLTKPGAEPHDLELAPRDVARLSDAALVVYLADFQPAVDDAVEAEAADHALDVTDAARLSDGDDGADADHPDEHADDHADDHAEDEHADEHADEHSDEHADDDHGHGATDPHFWLDPTRLADVGDAVAERLSAVDPDGADAYRANAEALRADLEALDAELEAGLAGCASRDLVVSHEAFGYLADRYGFEQVGISGLSPESDPRPQDLAAVTEFVTQHAVSTVYYETLVDPAVARTVAEETGARTAVLDPIEGLTDESAGSDYREVMLANLETLREGQSCP